ncbi:hypothetical protein TWF696_000534 [Orbilia brochopaga]|uniref:Uncharacterized protein n=1 Tax=Orbilia brochopaga TaxID=3140254 RepID=A0AAV9VDX0_9PEZI
MFRSAPASQPREESRFHHFGSSLLSHFRRRGELKIKRSLAIWARTRDLDVRETVSFVLPSAAKADSEEATAGTKAHRGISGEDFHDVLTLLRRWVPTELALKILDDAEYHPHAILASSSRVSELRIAGFKVYLSATIPKLTGESVANARIRCLIFRIRSWDGDGIYHHRRNAGTYKSSWSWLDAEIWREMSPAQRAAAQTAFAASKPKPPRAADDVDSDDESSSSREFYYDDFCCYRNTKERKGEIIPQRQYKVGTWLLQRNVVASHGATEHEIVWDWKIDEPPDEDMGKWEDGVRDQHGWTGIGRWHKDGRMANGQFVRELQPGDEVRVVMRTLYAGWRCVVESCEIECWWTV